MTDYEILAIVLLVITLAFSIQTGIISKKSIAAIQRQLVGGTFSIEGRSSSRSVIPSGCYYSMLRDEVSTGVNRNMNSSILDLPYCRICLY